MKYHEILSVLTQKPNLITPDSHASLLSLFEQHMNLSRADFKAAREGVDFCGEAVELAQAEIIDGIMHIPIGGPIGRGLDKFEKGAGAVDVDDIMDEIDQGEEDYKVSGFILDIDSPGGMVSGTPELADRIAAVEKPIYAFTAGQMCSAAYWIAASCDMICASAASMVGSIGVLVPTADYSEMYKTRGVKIKVFASGKYKGAGYMGTTMTEAQEEDLQRLVNEIADMFYSQVLGNRPDVDSETMQGQVYTGRVAMDRGLVDEIVRSKADVVDLLREGPR